MSMGAGVESGWAEVPEVSCARIDWINVAGCMFIGSFGVIFMPGICDPGYGKNDPGCVPVKLPPLTRLRSQSSNTSGAYVPG